MILRYVQDRSFAMLRTGPSLCLGHFLRILRTCHSDCSGHFLRIAQDIPLTFNIGLLIYEF